MSIMHKAIRDDEKEWPSAEQGAFFESLFHTYYKTLCRFSFRIVQDKDKAEDVVQTCFINLWEKRDSTNIKSSFICTDRFTIEVLTNTPERKKI